MPELPAAAAAQLTAQLAELGEQFQRSLPERVRQIEAALILLGERAEGAEKSQDREADDEAALRELCAAAHRLAGAAGTFGHPALGAAALQIETLARQLEADPTACVDAARAAFDRLLTTLRAAAETSPPVGTTLAAALSGDKK